MPRVIVTGSRRWPASRAAEIERALATLPGWPGEWIVVHGAARGAAGEPGADLIAARFALFTGARTEPHPADWGRGLRAGPERNARMVAAGADVVLAFPLPGSRGTWSCVRLALKAGLVVRVLGDGGKGGR